MRESKIGSLIADYEEFTAVCDATHSYRELAEILIIKEESLRAKAGQYRKVREEAVECFAGMPNAVSVIAIVVWRQ